MPVPSATTSLPVVLERLHERYPDARYELNWETPLQLLVATILAAQCTDERVNKVTPALFRKYPDANAYANADLSVLEEDLRPTGFFREKAKKVQNACKDLVANFDGQVPNTMEEMVTLFGVARKTANVVLNTAFRLPTGVIVDTHVQRVSRRMGLTVQKNPEKIETDLMNLVPKEEWIFFGPAMVLHGRYTCTFHNPDCELCMMSDLCPKLGVGEESDGDPGEEAATPNEDTPKMATKKKPAAKTKTAPAKPTQGNLPMPAPVVEKVPSLRDQLPADWQEALKDEFTKPYFALLEQFVAQERAAGPVYPPADEVFSAFRATPFDKVSIVLLGQDPYHGAGEAHGMCFSVKPGVKIPPSLVNIYKELQEDLGFAPVKHGFLAAWASQGVLMLNTVLTVQADKANSHREHGWETFTDAVIQAISARKKPAVFLLWGNPAKAKKPMIDPARHIVLEAGHPSPLSSKSFFGSKPFSKANQALRDCGQSPIDWQLPDEAAGSTPTTPKALPEPKATAAPKPAAPGTSKPAVVSAPVVVEQPTYLETLLPADWRAALSEEVRKPSFRQLDQFLAAERKSQTVCPEESMIFAALQQTPLDSVRLVIFGQEPPCQSDVADGLAFSARAEVEPSETIRTIFRELKRQLGYRMPINGSLVPWARQGVLLLNGLLTVREGRPGSHKDKGWEPFTDAILKMLGQGSNRIVFALWGNQAAKKRALIDESRHVVLIGDHPTQAADDFVGSGVFAEINNALDLGGRSSVYWQLPYV